MLLELNEEKEIAPCISFWISLQAGRTFLVPYFMPGNCEPSWGTSAHGTAVHVLLLLLTPLRNTKKWDSPLPGHLKISKAHLWNNHRGFRPTAALSGFWSFCSKGSMFAGGSQVKKLHAGLPDPAVFCTWLSHFPREWGYASSEDAVIQSSHLLALGLWAVTVLAPGLVLRGCMTCPGADMPPPFISLLTSLHAQRTLRPRCTRCTSLSWALIWHQHAANQNQQSRNKTHIFNSSLQSFGNCTQKEQDKLPRLPSQHTSLMYPMHLTHVPIASHSCTQNISLNIQTWILSSARLNSVCVFCMWLPISNHMCIDHCTVTAQGMCLGAMWWILESSWLSGARGLW